MRKWNPLTDAELDAQIEEARQRSVQQVGSLPRAVAARYDAETQRIIVDLKSGVTVMVPRSAIRELEDASLEEIARVSISTSGEGLHWDELDVHVSVPGLMLEIVGPRAISEELARRAGRASSEAKAKAARENGKKGGRPRKVAGG
jgi:hypothetical protein